ncbi:hypothetical protein FA95DRAFT_1543115 [Auriscalpium vulgare]|uniref:Uncharacterized protein n=1 Tax=Auriscalpium vulgare TaxID=40419 RepID=A0ACB8RPS6_9AGAM|nr:hypothetical protein FA95DRAFT_1543115 [Auriscalpium vulgare]
MAKGSKAAANTTYELRDIVLGKIRGYPPWPGMVVDPTNVSKTVLKEQPRGKKSAWYCVRFFPKGDYAWLVPKDMSRLQTHEIEAYINEPFKRSGELLNSYRVALDPAKWEEQIESSRVAAAEEEALAEVDQLETETDPDREADADGDADEDDKPAKPRKRKRDSDAAGAGKGKPKSAKAKKESAEPATKKKAAGAKGKRNGAKSKAVVESEDDGERAEAEGEADAEEDEDAGPSKHTSPPPAKKRKEDDPIATDPEAIKVREWRHKLQKTFLNETKGPKADDMPACDELFTMIEQYDQMNIQYLSFSKIGKVMRHIHMQPLEKVPLDETYNFRQRAKVLVDKWHVVLNATKEGGADSKDRAKANGVAKELGAPTPAAEEGKGGKAEEKMDVDPPAPAPAAGEPIAEVNGNGVEPAAADVTMADA